MNLIDMIKDQVTGSLTSNASKFLGESESGVSKALDGIFPALLGKMISRSDDQGNLNKIFDMAKGADTGMMDNIGDLFGGGAGNVAKLMNNGSGVLNLLLGNNSGSMIEKVAGFSGMKSSATSSLIKMAAPFLMSMVGKYIKDKALDAVGLGKFLGTQKSVVQNSMPKGLLGSLGAGFLGKGFDTISGIAGNAKNVAGGAVGTAGDAVGAAGDAGRKVVGGAKDLVGGAANMAGGAAGDIANVGKSAGGGIMKFLIPLILILGALGVWKSGILGDAVDATTEIAGDAANAAGNAAGAVADAAGDAAGAVGDAAGDAAGAVGDVMSNTFGKIDEAAKKALDGISFGANSAGKQMMNYIDGGFKGDSKFTFNNLTFASGSSTIAGESGAEVDNLAAILKAYPEVKIAITGYTDSQGAADSNIALSTARANSVKGRLMGKGIDVSRLTTRGMGAADPVATNDTPEGRAQNRRIEVTIMN